MTPSAPGIIFHQPAEFLADARGFIGIVEGADRLAGVFESGIVFVDLDLGQETGHMPRAVGFPEGIFQGLYQLDRRCHPGNERRKYPAA